MLKRFKNKVPIAIRCDNSRDVEMIPSDMSDFNVYGGIYRLVHLIYVLLLDADGVPCLDARNYLEFSLAGDGNLIDNQGTSTGSRKLQAYNGRAQIKVKLNGSDTNVVIVKSPKINSKVAMVTCYQ
ncbi:hypothetical protein AGMMS49982_05950 [Bacteroidia bacterium]|nr:hypothetical protein AGMMS49982_05950 [Bacteroidia bacterium]